MPVMSYSNPRHAPRSVVMLRPPSGGHGNGAWKDESSRRQRLDSSIVSLAHWVSNANQPNAPPIRAVSAGGNHDTRVQTFEDDSTEPASQQ